MNRTVDSRTLALQCAGLAEQKKASHIVVLDVRGIFSLAGYFVICSAESDRQTRAIASHIEDTMGRGGIEPLGVEGMTEGRWVLMDYDEVIVHVFQEEVRSFYDLEGLWGEAPRIGLRPGGAPIRAVDGTGRIEVP